MTFFPGVELEPAVLSSWGYADLRRAVAWHRLLFQPVLPRQGYRLGNHLRPPGVSGPGVGWRRLRTEGGWAGLVTLLAPHPSAEDPGV